MRLFLAGLLLAMTAHADSPQTITALNAEDVQRLEQQRAVVFKLVHPQSRANYEQPAGKLGTLRAILAAKVFSAEQTYELQSLGVVFGDVFVQDMGFEWVMVQDEHGRDPAIRYPDTSVLLFPVTMISKRVERGETVDVFELYNGVAEEAQQLIDRERASH